MGAAVSSMVDALGRQQGFLRCAEIEPMVQGLNLRWPASRGSAWVHFWRRAESNRRGLTSVYWEQAGVERLGLPPPGSLGTPGRTTANQCQGVRTLFSADISWLHSWRTDRKKGSRPRDFAVLLVRQGWVLDNLKPRGLLQTGKICGS